MKTTIALAIIVLLAVNAASGQEMPPRTDVVKVLVPIRVSEFSGQGGSLWKNKLWIHNDSDVEARVFRLKRVSSACPPHCGGSVLLPVSESIPSGSSVQIDPLATGEIFQVGEFFYVDRSVASQVFFSLRTYDERRNTLSAGTQVPIVNEHVARMRVQLLGVPVSPRFRYMLRVYTFGYTQDPSITPTNRIRLFDAATNSLLRDDPIVFNGFLGEGIATYTLQPYPNQLMLNLSTYSELAGAKSIRIEIESNFYRFWALLSLTNNDSDEVTLFSSQPASN